MKPVTRDACWSTTRWPRHLKTGDVIEIQFGSKSVKVEVLDVQETVRKDDAKELYRYL